MAVPIGDDRRDRYRVRGGARAEAGVLRPDPGRRDFPPRAAQRHGDDVSAQCVAGLPRDLPGGLGHGADLSSVDEDVDLVACHVAVDRGDDPRVADRNVPGRRREDPDRGPSGFRPDGVVRSGRQGRGRRQDCTKGRQRARQSSHGPSPGGSADSSRTRRPAFNASSRCSSRSGRPKAFAFRTIDLQS